MFAALLLVAMTASPPGADLIQLAVEPVSLKVDRLLMLEAAVTRATHPQFTLLNTGGHDHLAGSGVRVVFNGRVGQNLGAGLHIEGASGGLQVFSDVQVPTFAPASGELLFMSGLRKSF